MVVWICVVTPAEQSAETVVIIFPIKKLHCSCQFDWTQDCHSERTEVRQNINKQFSEIMFIVIFCELKAC